MQNKEIKNSQLIDEVLQFIRIDMYQMLAAQPQTLQTKFRQEVRDKWDQKQRQLGEYEYTYLKENLDSYENDLFDLQARLVAIDNALISLNSQGLVSQNVHHRLTELLISVQDAIKLDGLCDDPYKPRSAFAI